MKKTIIAIILVTLIATTNAALDFNNGQIHDVDYDLGHTTYIHNDPFWDDPTTVNFMDNAKAHSISVFDDSILNVLGGEIQSVSNKANLNIVEGDIVGYLILWAGSKTVIQGGYLNLTQISSMGILDIYDGDFDFKEGYNGLIISGGTRNSYTTIYGSNFRINGRPVQYGTYTSGEGVLTGKLQGGSCAYIPFKIDSGSLTLATPEPTTLILLATGFFFIRTKK